MNVENAQVQMRKGILEYCILHIISRGEIYASEILNELIEAKIMVKSLTHDRSCSNFQNQKPKC